MDCTQGNRVVDMKSGAVFCAILAVLTVFACGCSTTTGDGPVLSYTCTPDSGVVPLLVTCDASGSHSPNGQLDYLWQYNDGTYDTGPVVNHTFETTTGQITVRIKDPAGLTAESTRTFQAGIRLDPAVYRTEKKYPVAVMDVYPLAGTDPLAVTLDASKSYDPDGTIRNYYWAVVENPKITDGYSLNYWRDNLGKETALTTTQPVPAAISGTVTVSVVETQPPPALPSDTYIKGSIVSRNFSAGNTYLVQLVLIDNDGKLSWCEVTATATKKGSGVLLTTIGPL